MRSTFHAMIGCALIVTAWGCKKGGEQATSKPNNATAPDDKSAKDKPSTDKPSTDKPSTDKPKAMTAAEFGKLDFAQLTSMQGKPLAVTGTVVCFEQSQMGSGVVLQAGDGIRTFYTADKQPWKKVMPGQTVKVVGEVDAPINMKNGRLEDIAGKSVPTRTADELVAGAEMLKKEKGKGQLGVIVKGEIVRVEKKEKSIVAFKTSDTKSEVLAYISDGRLPKVGDTVVITGLFDCFKLGDKQFLVNLQYAVQIE